MNGQQTIILGWLIMIGRPWLTNIEPRMSNGQPTTVAPRSQGWAMITRLMWVSFRSWGWSIKQGRIATCRRSILWGNLWKTISLQIWPSIGLIQDHLFWPISACHLAKIWEGWRIVGRSRPFRPFINRDCCYFNFLLLLLLREELQ